MNYWLIPIGILTAISAGILIGTGCYLIERLIFNKRTVKLTNTDTSQRKAK